MTCPAPERLLEFALGAASPNSAISRHLTGCIPCTEEVRALRQAAADLSTLSHPDDADASPDCLDEIAIADFVDGRLDGERRHEALSHLGGCSRCRTAVRATAQLAADPSVVNEIPYARERRRTWPLVGVAAAAAAIIIVAGINVKRDTSRPVLRESAVTSAVAPVTLTPRGLVGTVTRLVWSHVPGAERYRVRLHQQDGMLLWTADTPDTSLALPDSVRLSPGPRYRWRVEAQTEWRRWVASDLTSFELSPP